MKTLISSLLTVIVIFSGCSKKKDTLILGTLKAIPSATVNGKTITFDASKSTGAIVAYGWALTIYSPTQGGSTNPITYSPNVALNHIGSDFISMTATVTKSGTYVFSLIVYDESPLNGNLPIAHQDKALLTVEVK